MSRLTEAPKMLRQIADDIEDERAMSSHILRVISDDLAAAIALEEKMHPVQTVVGRPADVVPVPLVDEPDRGTVYTIGYGEILTWHRTNESDNGSGWLALRTSRDRTNTYPQRAPWTIVQRDHGPVYATRAAAEIANANNHGTDDPGPYHAVIDHYATQHAGLKVTVPSAATDDLPEPIADEPTNGNAVWTPSHPDRDDRVTMWVYRPDEHLPWAADVDAETPHFASWDCVSRSFGPAYRSREDAEAARTTRTTS